MLQPLPLRACTCNCKGPVVGTPGNRFCSLVLACSDYVPVVNVVMDSMAHVDDVVVLPPKNEQTKPVASLFIFVTVDPSLFAQVDKGTKY